MDHQRFPGRRRAVVAGEVNYFGRNNARFSSLEETTSFSFDFDDDVALDHVEHFLRTRVDVPGSRGTGREFDDADYRFLNDLALTLKVVTQDLGKFRRCLREGDLCDGWDYDCKS